MEETPAESSEDELVAPSQVTARVGLELVAAALDLSYSLGRGSQEGMQMESKTRSDKTTT